ncbi:MAG: hypothetical protein KA184_07530 [Candidatus Hydrogenedentes bacterium]|nr:hypothetical protein [Candidatus Hydrogenedentota bacterium]
MTIQCCVCKKTKVDGEWRVTPPVTGPDISHTYCPACLVECAARLAAERAAGKDRRATITLST